MISNDLTTLDFSAYNFDSDSRSSIIASLQQRMKFFTYMRSSLYSNSLRTGALLSPLFVDPTFTEDVQASKDLSSVFFGPAIKADFMFKQFTNTKDIRFPANSKWLNLNTLETVLAGPQTLSKMFKFGLNDPVPMF